MKKLTLLIPAIILLVGVGAQSTSPDIFLSLFSNDDHHAQDRSKIIKFSHKYHIQDVQAECSTCHAKALTSKASGDKLLGDHETCAGCHDLTDDKKCGVCHVDKDNPVAFDNPKRDFTFSHQQHAGEQKLKCESCHAGLENVTYAEKQNMPTMETCNTCHNDRKVSNQCETCHKNFTSLIPSEHRTSDFRRAHRNSVRLGAIDVSCQTCHTETTCQNCHQPGSLMKFGKDNASDPRALQTMKDPARTPLQNIHDINYRFTHAIDAKSRQADCASCHEVKEFCAQCHNEGGHINQSKFKPKSHSVPGFTMLVKGSGGGDHAQQAKRDIETCMACHNVEGRDPTCMLCHSEKGTVR